jgi:hypothetical protein
MPDLFPVSTSDLTDSELIAAIIDDSRGYASYSHAKRHVEDFHAGIEHTACERGTCCFDRDLEALIERAARHWRWLLANDPPRAAHLLAQAESLASVTDPESTDGIAEMEFSMSYPVGGV